MEETLQYTTIKKLVPNSLNPRKDMGDLTSMTASIVAQGVIQPLLVRPCQSDDKFEIVAGERRFTAIQNAISAKELPNDFQIPIISKELDDDTVLQMMCIENLQREGLTDHDQAAAFKAYLDKYPDNPKAIEEIAEKTGITVHYIRRRAQVMELPGLALELWNNGQLAYGHLEQLLRIDPTECQEYIDDIIGDGMTVAELKDRIDDNQAILSKALFSTEDCNKCQFSTKSQKALFGDDFKADKNMCNNPKCYRAKQQAFLTDNWKDLPVVIEAKTNGVVVSSSFGATSGIHAATAKACEECEHFILQIHMDGTSYHARACKNESPACFKKNYHTASTSLTLSSGEPLTPEQVKTEKLEKRAENVGKEFAEIFYKERLPASIAEANLGVIYYVAIKSMTKAYPKAVKNMLGINKDTSWEQEHAILDAFYDLIATMDDMDLFDKLKSLIAQIVLTGYTFSLNERIDIANQCGLHLETEFLMTEDYLKKKTKDQLIDMNDQFKILPDYSRTGLEPFKKTEIVARLAARDLKGMIPDEIKAVAAGKPEPDTIEEDTTMDEYEETDAAVNE